ncbi:hypothetical protein RQP46_009665 [Phenoliferia psychrophenolica]
MRKVCSYYSTPKGCWKGANCTFRHGDPDLATTTSSTSTQPTRPRLSTSEYLTGVPPGACKTFWETGKCHNGVLCKYKHNGVKTGVAPSNPAVSTSDDLTSLATSSAPPNQQLLQKLIKDEEYRFRGPFDVYDVVEALYASTNESALWTHANGQAILAGVATEGGPALARIGEILCNWKLSATAATQADKLSFQRGFLFSQFLASRAVRNSPMSRYVNALYACVHSNAASWAPEVAACLSHVVQAKTLKERRIGLVRTRSAPNEALAPAFASLHGFLYEYFTRFPDALIEVPALPGLFESLQTAFLVFSADMRSTSPTFDDIIAKAPVETRIATLDQIENKLSNLGKSVKRVAAQTFVPGPTRSLTHLRAPSRAVVAALERLFVPPGELRLEGARNDNDFARIEEIKILPTHEELLCTIPPFVPANLPEAPHHLPVGTMARQRDLLFRLLREDFLSPVRSAVTRLFQDLADLSNKKATTSLGPLLKRGGGRYRAHDNKNAADLNVYTDVKSQKLGLSPIQHELVVHLAYRTPPGFAIGKGAIRKRLTRGSLVGLLSRSGNDTRHIFLGIVNEDPRSASGDGREVVVVSFYEAEVYIHAIQQLAAQHTSQADAMIFFEIQGFILDTLKPFLESLQRLEPESIPFAKYLSAVPGPTAPTAIDPPLFARRQGFKYNLTSLLKDGAGSLYLDALDADSVAASRDILAESSKLDPSQAHAPPGTGKSWLGVELIRVLLENDVGLILILAYTNHALDTLLKSIYDSGVTKDIVRGGAGTKDEFMSTFTLKELSKAQAYRHDPLLFHEMGKHIADRKLVEQELDVIASVSSLVTEERLEWPQVQDFLLARFPDHHFELASLPSDLVAAITRVDPDGWQIAGSRAVFRFPQNSSDVFQWWRDGQDHALMGHLRQAHDTRAAEEAEHLATFSNQYSILPLEGEEGEEDELDQAPRWRESFDYLDARSDSGASDASSIEELFPEDTWTEPRTDRPIEVLLEQDDIWSLSKVERLRLCRHWAQELVLEKTPALDLLRARLSEINEHIKTIKAQGHLALIKNAKIIGCTTNSAANILELIKSAGPVCILVEEAGECLEAQVVANLVESVQSLVMIGDHKQLRPHVTCHHLSVDSAQGQIHRHDVSLFERLASLPLPMSLLKTQRRMRPIISSLIKNHLYPELEDAPNVLNYPKVRGMAKDVYFIDHNLLEDRQASQHSSKSNKKEAIWVVDLVRHLLKQGYRENEIAVLTPYLGQLTEIRRLLTTESIVVHLDERDLADLADSDTEEAVHIDGGMAQKKSLDSQVILRTVDNFQGEEATIVILSLVRSDTAGVDEETGIVLLDRDAKASIGFLKSSNRTNVALSRAKHGLYIFGNARLFADQSKMWRSVVDELATQDLIGTHLPAICERHPNEIGIVDAPGRLPSLAPAGGCHQTCDYQLACGHRCTQKCHPQDLKHEHFQCPQPCRQLLACGHPCRNLCGDAHGPCRFRIPTIQLPCGHKKTNVQCSHSSDIASIPCSELVVKPLSCGHTITLPCSIDPTTRTCHEPCGGSLDCKHSSCVATCGDCPTQPDGTRKHAPHRCDRLLQCGHVCKGSCEPCSRLPCDRPCTKILPCSHRCPSICGEACAHQLCPSCAPSKDQVVDFILFTALGDFNVDAEDPSERLITLGCGHAFTVETLDGLFNIERFYRKDEEGRWIGLAHPEDANDVPPVCSLCRTPISSLFVQRYGRSLKHAELNARERNAMVRGTAALATLSQAVAALSLEDINSKLEKFDKALNKKRAVAPILRAYKQATQLLGASPHLAAYEGAVSQRYDEELRRLTESKELVRNPEKAAIEFARISVGAPPPKADQRCAVDAIFITLDLRLALVDAARALIAALVDRKDSDDTAGLEQNIVALRAFAFFIAQTCRKDVLASLKIATESHAQRQALQANLRLLRIKLELSRLDVHFDLETAGANRKTIGRTAEQAMESAVGAFDVAVSHFRAQCPKEPAALAAAEDFIEASISPSRTRIADQWLDVIRFAKAATFYAPVTAKEREEVVRTMGFATSGHWYRCPDGHPFSIGECGGAMELAICPECGQPIGGGSHRLTAGNSRDDDLERIAIAGGARHDGYFWN